MISIRTAPICVIDDEKSEYEKLLAILNKIGLGCVHFKGDTVESLPEKPIKGLRVVFLDLHLGIEDFGKTDYTQVANVFSKIVDETESAPVLVIIWTKHTDESDRFREALYQAKPPYRGRLLFAIMREKPQDRSGGNIEAVRDEVIKILAEAFPIGLIWAWDALVQDAARATTGELLKLALNQVGELPAEAANERKKIDNALRGILRALLDAQAGETLSKEGAPQELLCILSTLHSDRLENASELQSLDGAANLVEIPGANPGEQTKIALNSMLLLGRPPAGTSYCPGTLFEITDRSKFEACAGVKLGPMEALLYRSKINDQNRAAFETWASHCRPILLEISPSCDFAQDKRAAARMVAGLLIPGAIAGDAKAGKDAARPLHLLKLPEEEEVVLPSFCSGLGVSIDLTAKHDWLKPVARVKEPLLTDLRNWMTAQGARVGYSFL